MKVVILAGGLGTRISEESHLRPKPMIEIGELPILVHIMKIYASQGFNEFIVCAGYKQEMIKEYFAHYFLYNNDVTFKTSTNERTIHKVSNDSLTVTVVDTGLYTNTAGRIKRVQKYIGNEPFFLTYGDAVGDIDIKKLLKFHNESKKIGTISCYNFGQSKGVIELDSKGNINVFREKSDLDGDLINIGFMVMEPEIFELMGENCDDVSFEKGPMEKLVKMNQLNAYIHHGFWQCMDTLREKEKLEELWETGKAPWKIWSK